MAKAEQRDLVLEDILECVASLSLGQTETTNAHDNVFNLGIFNKSSVAVKIQAQFVHSELWTRQKSFNLQAASLPTCVSHPCHAMPGPGGHGQAVAT